MAQKFAAQARVKNHVALQPKNRTSCVLVDWRRQLALSRADCERSVELVFRYASGSSWNFSTGVSAGNELNAIEICRGYVEAQHEYALIKRALGRESVCATHHQHAGKQDGLAWKTRMARGMVQSVKKWRRRSQRGYTNRTEPFHGYFFKVLKGQGPAAPLGELDFVVKDVMIGGFALIAFPAQYRLTGVQTFIVSHDGVVYQKDLGPKTTRVSRTRSIDSIRTRAGLRCWTSEGSFL